MLKVLMLGRLTKDAELRTTQSGKKVATFTVACNAETKDGKAEFVNCIAWEKTAEAVVNYCSKGSQLYAEGRLQTRSYETNGTKRYVTEVVVSRVEFVGSKQGNKQDGTGGSGEWGKPVDDDIPF